MPIRPSSSRRIGAKPSRRTKRLGAVLIAAVLALLVGVVGAVASPGDTERVSVDSAGNEGNQESVGPSVSADGRFVAYWSFASNLVPDDANGQSDVFVHDRQSGTTERVSLDSTGIEGDGGSSWPEISADGRHVAFTSQASNLVAADTNGQYDIFVHDRQSGTTERVSVDSAGNEGVGISASSPPAISADGRFVSFDSEASNLVADDTNGQPDIFVRDRQLGTTERVSVDSAGNEGDSSAFGSAISADGRFVGFSSYSSNLVADDTNGQSDIFVRDRLSGTTERVSVDSDEVEGNNYSSTIGSLSADGRYVGFVSNASNLHPGDLNGSQEDIFVRDRQSGTTERVNVDSGGNEPSGFGHAAFAELSADGRFVAFTSEVRHLVPDDTTFGFAVFVHDRQTGHTQQVSRDSAGNEANGHSFSLAISADGHFVAFDSYATNLVADDTNEFRDVFVHELDPTVPPMNSANARTAAGGTASTNSTTSPDDPVGTSVTTPVGGVVTIGEGDTTTPEPSGYSLLGQQVDITAPDGSSAEPLVLEFRLDASLLPLGADENSVEVFRNGALVPDCDAGAGTSATPDPCVAGRAATASGIELTIRTSQASSWNFGVTSGDATAPETTIDSGPTGRTNDSTPTFGFSSSEPGSTFQCRFDSAAFGPCSGPGATHTPPGPLSNGDHTFEVRATDAANNTDQSPAARSFTVDTQAPNTFIAFGPSGPTNDSTPTFYFFSSESGSSFQCRVDNGAFSPCSSPKTLAALSDGSHTFRVRATDQAGNTDQSPAVRTFTVDTQAPNTTITSGPTGNTRDRTPTFGFSSSQSGSDFQCRLDGASFSPCNSPKTYSTLSFGSHTFRVRAIDPAGNVDASPATRTFNVIR